MVPVLLAAACASTQSPEGRITRESDGAWVRTYRSDRDTVYHTAVGVLRDEGYNLTRANPMAGSFSAKSEVTQGLGGLHYRMARVDIESAPGGGVRLRLLITRTHEPEGAGRRPNNDRPETDEALYDDLLTRIARALEAPGK
jgi:hypothetical protein